MLTEPQKRWVEALRSGKYEQGIEHLNLCGKFCCLGVACEIFKDELNLIVEVKRDETFYNGEGAYLPKEVQKHLGLKSPYGAFLHNDLYILNDRGISFKEIADIIESKPKGLFVDRPAEAVA